jgi:hypothetical protein
MKIIFQLLTLLSNVSLAYDNHETLTIHMFFDEDSIPIRSRYVAVILN